MSLQDRSSRIDHAAPVHLWRQVADDLRKDIETGVAGSGSRLPSELELAEQYGVSRVTIRRSLEDLISDGLIVIVRGRGTYVK